MIFSNVQIREAVRNHKAYLRLSQEAPGTDPMPEHARLRHLQDLQRSPRIHIDNFDPEKCGPNSYDLTLADTLLVYAARLEDTYHREVWVPPCRPDPLDMHKNNPTREIKIPPEGLVLEPGTLYLGATREYTETHNCVPWLDGRSSTGRLGLFAHISAGRGDRGFQNVWTLELVVIHPLRIYAGDRVAQVSYFESGYSEMTYGNKGGKYNGTPGEAVLPTASRAWVDARTPIPAPKPAPASI